MTLKISAASVLFRPHFKTHQSKIIGGWFRKEGIRAITVSSVKMAEYFAADGWEDITIAFPVNLRESSAINKLAGQIKLNILIAGTGIATELNKRLSANVGAWIKIDTGYGRSGIRYDNTADIDSCLSEIGKSAHLSFEGFLSHTGNTYHAGSRNEILELFEHARSCLVDLKDRYIKDQPGLKISLGDTPSSSVCTNFQGIDELRPGNFVFYDLMQEHLGACSLNQVATLLACPVVASYSKRREIIIYGGAIHLSKEFISNSKEERNFGQVALLTQKGWDPLPGSNKVVSLSQEHGIVRLDKEYIGKIKAGDLIGIIAVHSCLTAEAMKSYYSLDGKIIDHM